MVRLEAGREELKMKKMFCDSCKREIDYREVTYSVIIKDNNINLIKKALNEVCCECHIKILHILNEVIK